MSLGYVQHVVDFSTLVLAGFRQLQLALDATADFILRQSVPLDGGGAVDAARQVDCVKL